ncbi:immunoglobulin superfamily member 3-like [Oxyura jamaicensis]|uniref:immunoglobulin superfamily member 3-like n=1 Tax=Oxyura jamaicensis TaxID=8884 RepID=UPI0015A6D3ED|nr:immunoglobulin superfamily member 3-like [Oxyura jamaicensis]
MGLAWHRVAALLVFFLLLGVGAGQRVVTIQKGPLYRVRGSHVTLWCKVSGYQGPAEQNFQWSIYLPSAPEREVQIVSTADPSFPYAVYAQRVRSQEIYVERVQGDAVLLHIKELQDRDAGEYECHTPNTDERYFGSYSAKMNLSVIPDTLSVSMGSQVLTQAEGDAVELTCEVSKTTAQHTHLSVGWYRLQGAGEHQAEEILTLSKDFVLRLGPSYTQRFLSGNVRLDKVGNTTYKLSIAAVEPSDQGQLYCEAAEWIEDPDETWKDISRKQTEKTVLSVTTQDHDLHVGITASKSSLSEGDILQLNCTLGAQRSGSRCFKVAWLLDGVEVARFGPCGLLAWKKEYEERAGLGHLRAFKQSSTVYILTVYGVGPKDSGAYHCSASEVKAPGDVQSIQTNLSSAIRVDVKPIGLGLHATLISRTATVRYTQSFELVCQVNASRPIEEVLLSVGWLFQSNPPDGSYQELVRVLPDGTVSWGPAQPRFQGKAQLGKVDTSSRLHIHGAVSSHAGRYQCEVGLWRTPWGQPTASATSNAVGIQVIPPESKLQVATKESSVEVAGGADTSIECRILSAQNNSQLAVAWYFLPPTLADATPLQILRASYSGLLEYGAEFSSPAQRSRFLSQRVSNEAFQLRILSAVPGDEGGYRCVVEEWRWLEDRWHRLGEGRSGRTLLRLRLPESELHLEQANRSISAREGEEVTLGCLLQDTRVPTARLSASWFRGEEGGHPRTLLTLHHDGSIQYPQEGLAGRLQLRRPAAGDFSLTLGGVEVGDAGLYHCQLEEWQQRGKGQWALQAWARSGYTRLTAIPKESTVLSTICSSPPLLNFILFLPLILILLLALAGFCWCFISRKSKKGYIKGGKLMELQGAGGVKQA